MTLFLPHNCPGFVSAADGSVNLTNILIPVAQKPIAQPSVEAALRTIHSLQLPAGRVELLHVGNEDVPVELSAGTNWEWAHHRMNGSPVVGILDRAKATKADLIIMTTDGPDGFLDGLRGTTSQRVLAQANCPVLIIPSTVFHA
jgi:nucleotide-binding universal stress UspA family protein